jgi:hypothetical protein
MFLSFPDSSFIGHFDFVIGTGSPKVAAGFFMSTNRATFLPSCRYEDTYSIRAHCTGVSLSGGYRTKCGRGRSAARWRLFQLHHGGRIKRA